jgi:hypothetical protein
MFRSTYTAVIRLVYKFIKLFFYNNNNNNNEMYDYTSNNWSHWGCNEKLKKQFGSCTRKTLDRLGTSHIIRKALQCEA